MARRQKNKPPDEDSDQSPKARALMLQFLKAYVEHRGHLTKAAETVGCARAMHHKWMARKDYQQLFADAKDQVLQDLEAEADRRAVDGVPKANGEVQYSDTLLIFRLKGLAPHKYRDRMELSLPVEQIDAAIEQQLERLAAARKAPAPESPGS